MHVFDIRNTSIPQRHGWTRIGSRLFGSVHYYIDQAPRSISGRPIRSRIHYLFGAINVQSKIETAHGRFKSSARVKQTDKHVRQQKAQDSVAYANAIGCCCCCRLFSLYEHAPFSPIPCNDTPYLYPPCRLDRGRSSSSTPSLLASTSSRLTVTHGPSCTNPPRVLLLLLLAVAGSHAGATTPTLVFILAGQSNMGGRGGATSGKWDGVVPHECAPSPRVLRLSPGLRWEEAREPLHAGIDVGNVLGVGPGMPFAHAVVRAAPPGSVIGLVPCAQGGTPIANWSRGTDLYDRMITRARAAVAETGGRGKLAAMLWFQGETDTIRREDAIAYTARMEAMVRDVRRDLAMPDLLVIQVGIATGQGKFIDLMRKAQKAVKLPNLKYVDAKGLPIAGDYTHLTTQAQVRLGDMLAKAYLATL